MPFDPTSPDFKHDPYPIYAELRAQTPIYHDDALGMWVVARHEDVSALLRDRRLGRSIEHVKSRAELGLPPRDPRYAPFDRLSENSMFDKEPPDHTRLRGLVHKAFTPRRIEGLRQRIQATADALAEANKHTQPIPRGGRGSDIAEAALYLASDGASYVNGHAMVIDGGLSSSHPVIRQQTGRTSL